MDKILNQLIDGVSSGNVLIVVLIVTVAIIFNLEKIFSFWDTRKKVKIQPIEESLGNPHGKSHWGQVFHFVFTT